MTVTNNGLIIFFKNSGGITRSIVLNKRQARKVLAKFKGLDQFVLKDDKAIIYESMKSNHKYDFLVILDHFDCIKHAYPEFFTNGLIKCNKARFKKALNLYKVINKQTNTVTNLFVRGKIDGIFRDVLNYNLEVDEDDFINTLNKKSQTNS